MPFLLPFVPAIIAGGAAIAGAAITSNSNNKALDAQQAGDAKAIEAQNAGLDKVINLNKPYVDAGVDAQGQVMDALNGPVRTSTTPQVQGTPGAPASPGKFDGAAYFRDNPDVAAAYAADPYQQANPGQQDAYALAHFNSSGKAEGRQPDYVPGTATEATAATPDKPYVQDYTRPDQPTFQNPGAGPSSADYTDASKFTTSPGYEFRLNEGNRNLNSKFGARGLLKSGAAIKGFTDYNQGAASAEYANWFNQQMSKLGADQSQFNATANRNFNIFTDNRNNLNNNFNDDRSYGTNLGLKNREYDTNQDQTRISNLFGVTSNGRAAAGATGGAISNNANNVSNIYTGGANDAANTITANGANTAGAITGVAGQVGNIFAGTPRTSPTLDQYGRPIVRGGAAPSASTYDGPIF